MEIGTTTPTAATAAAQTAANAAPKAAISSDFETFLRMLTTQMQNQDPMNPMNSTEFATQLATFSSVEQQTRTNDMLGSIAQQLDVIGLSQVTSWVGRDARTSGTVWVDGSDVALTPNPARSADRMAVVIRNENGAEVGRQSMAASDEPIALKPLDAKGNPLPAGAYSFELESIASGTVLNTVPLEAYSRIVEVRNENGATQLIMQGGIKKTPAEVTALRDSTA